MSENDVSKKDTHETEEKHPKQRDLETQDMDMLERMGINSGHGLSQGP